MESVYLETTFISYLVARRCRDLLVAAHQQATLEWWANRRSEFECTVSQVVIDEASVGDPTEVQKNSWEHSIMWEDPIVAEVHRSREKLAAACNYDLGAFFADVRKRQASLGSRLVPQKKRAEPTAEAGQGHHSGSPESRSAEATPAA